MMPKASLQREGGYRKDSAWVKGAFTTNVIMAKRKSLYRSIFKSQSLTTLYASNPYEISYITMCFPHYS